MATNVLVTINASKDNHLDLKDGLANADDNLGGWQNVVVGKDSFGTYRPVVFFDLGGVSNTNGPLVSARIQFSIRFVSGSHVRCASDSQGTGCATVHQLLKDWGEGRKGCCTNDATHGESSWIHNSFPSQWSSPGGDFEANPIGRRSVASEVGCCTEGVGEIAEFLLDRNTMAQILSGQTPYFGFLLMDDNDSGVTRFESRECAGRSSDSRCPNQRPPRLVLEFEDATPPPTNRPTRQPSLQPTFVPTSRVRSPTLPPTLLPSNATGDDSSNSPTASPVAQQTREPTTAGPTASGGTNRAVCSDFQQRMEMASRMSLSRASEFDIALKQELDSLPSRYLTNANQVTVSVFVSPSTQVDLVRSNGVQVQSAFRQCFEVPEESELVNQVDGFPLDFVTYMELPVHRIEFENRLVMRSFDVVPGSLSPVTLDQDPVAPTFAPVVAQGPASIVGSRQGESDNTAIVAGSAAGGAAVVLLILLLLWRRVRRRGRELEPPSLPGNKHETPPTSVDNPHSALPLANAIIREGQPTTSDDNAASIPTSDSAFEDSAYGLDYKRTGQSVDGEGSDEERQRPIRKSRKELAKPPTNKYRYEDDGSSESV